MAPADVDPRHRRIRKKSPIPTPSTILDDSGELKTGRISADLDVTDPEPSGADSELRTAPNVVLTPPTLPVRSGKISPGGAITCLLDRIERFSCGQPLKYQVTRRMLSSQA